MRAHNTQTHVHIVIIRGAKISGGFCGNAEVGIACGFAYVSFRARDNKRVLLEMERGKIYRGAYRGSITRSLMA